MQRQQLNSQKYQEYLGYVLSHITLEAESQHNDTTLQGAQVTAKRINADVGGKLHIESQQDQVTQSSSQSSAGVKVQAGLGTAWGASGNYANSEANGSSATVNRQSGLFAGDGGYHINAGSVELKGGAIASTADKEHNTLTAKGFSASDLKNESHYSATSVGLSGGYSAPGGSKGGSSSEGGTSSTSASSNPLQGISFIPTLPQHASGSSTSTTKATLTEGNIVINNTPTTAQALGVNTDASSAHQKVAELPDLQALQAKQQAVAQATTTVATAVQTFSQNQAKEAQKAQEGAQVEFEQTLKSSNPEGYAAYQKLDDSSKQTVLLADSKYAEAYNAARDWGMGGSNSRLLNAATTLVTGVLGGQSNLQAAANTLAPYAAQAIGQTVGHGDNKNEAAQAVGHMLLGAALAYANHANPVAGGTAAVAAEKTAEYLAQHYNDGKTALDPVTGQFNANLLPEEVKQEIKSTTGVVASLAGAVGTTGTGSAFNAQVAGVLGQNAAVHNDLLYVPLIFALPNQDKANELVKKISKKEVPYNKLTFDLLYLYNTDKNLKVPVDITGWKIKQNEDFRKPVTPISECDGCLVASGRIPYSDANKWAIHGSVALIRKPDGSIMVRDNYSFEMHEEKEGQSFLERSKVKLRNLETLIGNPVSSANPWQKGVDFNFDFKGKPILIRE